MNELKEYVTLFGKEMEIKAFMKKVNNMKIRLSIKQIKINREQTSSSLVLGDVYFY